RDRIVAINANSAVQVELSSPARVELPPEIETAAYRIADEALVNVLKHARASRCTVTISTDDGLRPRIADDGVGLNGAGRRGVGMASMRHRTERLGGTFTARNTSRGLEVVVQLPLEAR